MADGFTTYNPNDPFAARLAAIRAQRSPSANQSGFFDNIWPDDLRAVVFGEEDANSLYRRNNPTIARAVVEDSNGRANLAPYTVAQQQSFRASGARTPLDELAMYKATAAAPATPAATSSTTAAVPVMPSAAPVAPASAYQFSGSGMDPMAQMSDLEQAYMARLAQLSGPLDYETRTWDQQKGLLDRLAAISGDQINAAYGQAIDTTAGLANAMRGQAGNVSGAGSYLAAARRIAGGNRRMVGATGAPVAGMAARGAGAMRKQAGVSGAAAAGMDNATADAIMGALTGPYSLQAEQAAQQGELARQALIQQINQKAAFDAAVQQRIAGDRAAAQSSYLDQVAALQQEAQDNPPMYDMTGTGIDTTWNRLKGSNYTVQVPNTVTGTALNVDVKPALDYMTYMAEKYGPAGGNATDLMDEWTSMMQVLAEQEITPDVLKAAGLPTTVSELRSLAQKV